MGIEMRSCAACGKQFPHFATPSRVASGRGKFCSRSCSASVTSRVHGHNIRSGATPTYRSWNAMVSRCHNPRNAKFARYGAAGITVCDRWRESFANFLADMGERPAGHSIDRIDGAGPYSPTNCRWATPQAQQHNLRNNVIVEYRGERHCVSEWARISGIHCKTLMFRLRHGWPVHEALSTPPRLGNRVAPARKARAQQRGA